jgi:DNA mismatch repair protein MutS2
MNEQAQTESPDGVLVSSDAGTPSVFSGAWRLGGTPARGDGLSPDVAGSWFEALQALEFDAVLGDVAARAAGSLGAASVRARRPVSDLPRIREELARVGELATLARAGKGMVAEPVPELDQVLARLRVAGSVLDGRELVALRRTLAASRLVQAELRRIAADAPRIASLQLPPLEKSLERRLETALDDDGGVRDAASSALASARSDVRTARERLVQKLEAMLRGLGGEGGVTLREGRYVLPVPRDLRQRPDGIVHGESASGATLYIEPSAAIPLGNAMREAEARAQREELRVLRDLTELLRPVHAELMTHHATCVAVDDLVARARWAVDMDGHVPEVAAAPTDLRIVNGRHPLLLGGPPARPVVPFDLILEGAERTVLLSGPNTGGKSVLLKAVGLHVALTQSGVIPPVGPGSVLPMFSRVFADIGDRQSIAASLSTFSAHLTALRLILDEADSASLVLLDEIGSGTDPAEGAALAGAALVALTRRGAVTLATTHLGALKRLATTTPGIVNASLQFDAATLQPTYRLVKGIPGRSYGIAIARRLGLRNDVLAEAESHVPEAERSLDALLALVEQRARDQVTREQELTSRLEQVASQAQALAAQAEAQAVREQSLTRREREAERAGREQARRYLLEAREKVEAAIARAGAAGEEAAREARRAVEAAAALEAEALARADSATRRLGGPVAHAAGLEPGQRVRLQSGSDGEVLEIRGNDVVVRVGSLKLVVDRSALSPLPSRRAAEPPSRRVAEPPSRLAAEPSYEIDLRGLTGDEAEQVVVGALDRAVLAEQPFLRIIHGKGTGVVRERVQKVLGRDRRVRSHGFAPANQGGTGVTVVEFAP